MYDFGFVPKIAERAVQLVVLLTDSRFVVIVGYDRDFHSFAVILRDQLSPLRTPRA